MNSAEIRKTFTSFFSCRFFLLPCIIWSRQYIRVILTSPWLRLTNIWPAPTPRCGSSDFIIPGSLSCCSWLIWLFIFSRYLLSFLCIAGRKWKNSIASALRSCSPFIYLILDIYSFQRLVRAIFSLTCIPFNWMAWVCIIISVLLWTAWKISNGMPSPAVM